MSSYVMIGGIPVMCPDVLIQRALAEGLIVPLEEDGAYRLVDKVGDLSEEQVSEQLAKFPNLRCGCCGRYGQHLYKGPHGRGWYCLDQIRKGGKCMCIPYAPGQKPCDNTNT